MTNDRPPQAAILVTGSEILIGRTQDTNSAYLARALDGCGIRVVRLLAVDDDERSIVDGLRSLVALDVDLVVTSGGLGPTHDDRTVAAVALVADRPLVLDAPTLERIDAIVATFAAARGIDAALFAEGNRKQAHVPDGAIVLDPIGTAPGVVVGVGSTTVVVLPGPPVELQRMWLAPALRMTALRQRRCSDQPVFSCFLP